MKTKEFNVTRELEKIAQKISNDEQAIAYRKAHKIPRPKKVNARKIDVN